MDLDELTSLDRDESLYPDLPRQLPELLRLESRAFLRSLLSDPNATFSDLLGSRSTFANDTLAQHYGLESPAGDEFAHVEAPDRSGVLTQGMLAVRDGSTHSSIVRRGLKIRTDFLCQTVSPPPDSVDLTLDGIGADLTQAERLAEHRKNPSCRACHELMDPVGQSLDAFDAVGRYRTLDEHGNPIDSNGELRATRDANGKVRGVHELAQLLASSGQAQECYRVQNLRYFLGRDVTRDDMCTQAQVARHFEDTDMRLTDLIVGIIMSDAFLYQAKAERN